MVNIGIVKSIKPIGYADVYNMEVEDHHNFSVNGGLIVHNCRYGIASRPALTIINNTKPRDTFIYRDNTEANGYTGGEIPRSYIDW